MLTSKVQTLYPPSAATCCTFSASVGNNNPRSSSSSSQPSNNLNKNKGARWKLSSSSYTSTVKPCTHSNSTTGEEKSFGKMGCLVTLLTLLTEEGSVHHRLVSVDCLLTLLTLLIEEGSVHHRLVSVDS
ncbi:hypothetical protein Taro_019868 [Colocasia esculenta]|uniref:Uncharacterized protein n=1 Tax=Colocasia esculenta TaxID=4460 RepID=A0A843V0G0_COLES|nr:hypothetical protein [Colocasia esculenta]